MDLCWTEVSLLVKLALKVRGCEVCTVASGFCTMFPNTKDLAKLSFTCRAIILCKMRTALLLFVVGLCVLNVTLSLKICAFNVKSFGESKANNKKVMGILQKVLSCMCTK